MDDGGGDRFGNSRFTQNWRPAGYNGRSFSSGSSGRSWSGRSGSDGPSWRKDDGKGTRRVGDEGQEEDEVQSPLKEKQRRELAVKTKKVLFVEEGTGKATKPAGDVGDVVPKSLEMGEKEESEAEKDMRGLVEPGTDVNSAMHIDDGVLDLVQEGKGKEKEVVENGVKAGTYKKRPRASGQTAECDCAAIRHGKEEKSSG
ncbi:hypothetical protein C2845_PM17G04340 [Panicum miliaceum]|uniref:Uncharacterized protein n=1 Tax=Panicum miliaceum TaxID=4540 RepID=A0A3L6Q5D1_PANMI|nr:hypothetical protein C2845_PM17G04340 [Panicum miliaceum]